MKIFYTNILLLSALTLTTSCTTTPHSPQQYHEVTSSIINLPISHDTWSAWQCRDGSQLKTKFITASDKVLLLKYQNDHHILIKQANINPVIYQNSRIAFFSNGRTAVIGMPDSDLIYNSGCQIVHK